VPFLTLTAVSAVLVMIDWPMIDGASRRVVVQPLDRPLHPPDDDLPLQPHDFEGLFWRDHQGCPG
jgi:hypothetical protein